jgi:hypothetical protein
MANFLWFRETFWAGVPQEAARALAALRPPKRLFGFASDVTPRQSDVMQVTVIPPRQFKSLAPALRPDMQRLTELEKKPGLMMIYHRLV